MKRLVLALVVLAFAFSATAAMADTIEFSGIGGTWGWNGAPQSNGSSISTNSTLVIVSPPPIVLAGSAFSFTTGAWSTITSQFASGGSLAITDDLGGDCGGPCFTGTFTGAQTLTANNSGGWTFTGNFLAGTVSPYIWNALGFDPGPNGAVGGMSGQLIVTFNRDHQAIDSVGSLDMTLTRVPEPTSLAILGTAFLLGGATLRRKFAL
jgi:hypothetical protein